MASETKGPYSSAWDGFSITPNDSADLIRSVRSLYIGVTGDVKVDMVGGETITFKNVPVGIFPIQVKKVYATGTAASEIIGLD
jgi:hypothetical protein